jgi:signal peptidase II
MFRDCEVNMKKIICFLMLITVIIFFDQLTKIKILQYMLQHSEEINLLPFLNFTLVFNSGVAFGIFKNFGQLVPHVFSVIGLVFGLGLIIWAFLNKKHYFAMSLISAGALGNAIDRIRLGVVIDFIDVYWKNLHWPAFNIADISICLGACIFLCSELSKNKKRKV